MLPAILPALAPVLSKVVGNLFPDPKTKAMRYNFAGIGYHFDAVADAFYPPKPDGADWELNTQTYLWQRPEGWVDRPPAAETSETST